MKVGKTNDRQVALTMVKLRAHMCHLRFREDASSQSDLQLFKQTLMVVAAMQGADHHIRSSLVVQYHAQGHFDMPTR